MSLWAALFVFLALMTGCAWYAAPGALDTEPDRGAHVAVVAACICLLIVVGIVGAITYRNLYS